MKYLPNATYEIRDAQKEFPNTNPDCIEKSVCEVLNRTTTAGVISTLEDFILPQTRNAGDDYVYTFLFQNEKWFFEHSGFSDTLKNKILPEECRRITNINIAISISPDDFVSETEKQIISAMTPELFKGMERIQSSDRNIRSSFFYMIAQT